MLFDKGEDPTNPCFRLQTCTRQRLSMVEGLAIFAGSGAAIGLVAGLAVPQWKTIYRAF